MDGNIQSDKMTALQPLVSVIIPLYNAEKYIADCIKSVLNQSWPNVEVIIVDDGSIDNSLSIAKTFAANNIKVISQQNNGASAARNNGLAEAKGDYIQFLDADDLLSENKIEDQMLALNGSADHLSISKTIHFFDGTDHLLSKEAEGCWYNSDNDDPIDFLTKLYAGHEIYKGFGGMVTVHAWLIPRTLIDKAGLWNEKLTVDDDGDFFCRVILQSKGIKYATNAINYYRKFEQNMSLSSKKTEASFASRMLAIDLKIKYLKPYIARPILDKVFARHYWEIGVMAFPQYRQLSNTALKKAEQLGFGGSKYKAGKLSTWLSKLIGWRIVRFLSFLKHGF
jgi:glycosyltransferase involved in cell wall biosynthesis